jgi:hypothetical protein
MLVPEFLATTLATYQILSFPPSSEGCCHPSTEPLLCQRSPVAVWVISGLTIVQPFAHMSSASLLEMLPRLALRRSAQLWGNILKHETPWTIFVQPPQQKTNKTCVVTIYSKTWVRRFAASVDTAIIHPVFVAFIPTYHDASEFNSGTREVWRRK